MGVEHQDMLEILSTEFDSPDGFETLTPAQDSAVRDRFQDLHSQYSGLISMVDDINGWSTTAADGAYKDTVAEQFRIMFDQFNAGKVADVHFTDLPTLKPQLVGYHASWAALANK